MHAVSKIGKFIKSETRREVTRGWKNGQLLFHGVSVWNDAKSSRQIMVLVAQQCKCTKCHYVVYLKMVNCVCMHVYSTTIKKNSKESIRNDVHYNIIYK